MCGRFTNMFKWRELQVLMDLLDWTGVEIPARYNLAPTQQAPVVRADERGRHGLFMRWGLLPAWADDLAAGSRMINARAETIAEKPAFRHAFAKRRCLVPVSGFYEWKAQALGEKGPKQPYYIRRRDGEPFAIAGLWESNTKLAKDAGVESGPVETFTLITTTPNALMADLHDRMPVIVPRERHGDWLDPGLHDAGTLTAMLIPAAVEEFEKFPVGRLVSNPRLEGPDLIQRLEAPLPPVEPPARRPKRSPEPPPPSLWDEPFQKP